MYQQRLRAMDCATNQNKAVHHLEHQAQLEQ
jgi:hypothetical protein